MQNIQRYVGTFAKVVRTEHNDLYVFATNSVTTEGNVGYNLFTDLDSDKQDVVSAFIALVYGADACYIYSVKAMDEVLEELAEIGEYSEPMLLMKAPYNFGK